jgi:hypothetical protein
VERPAITRSDVSWAAFIIRVIVLLLGVAVLIGSALTALPFIWGMPVAFVALVLVVALIAFELPHFWARLPR